MWRQGRVGHEKIAGQWVALQFDIPKQKSLKIFVHELYRLYIVRFMNGFCVLHVPCFIAAVSIEICSFQIIQKCKLQLNTVIEKHNKPQREHKVLQTATQTIKVFGTKQSNNSPFNSNAIIP
jgi:hypothetical protein